MDTLLPTLRDAWLREFRKHKSYIDGAAAQLTDEQFSARPAPGLNSVALIVKHLAGNMKSRWTDWLTTDGEKPDRDRDREFVDEGESRSELMRRYEEGWALLLRGIESLRPEDLSSTVAIRSEPHSVPLAIERQLAHCAYHAGQVMVIARWIAGGANWKWQTVAPGSSAEFNAKIEARHGKNRT